MSLIVFGAVLIGAAVLACIAHALTEDGRRTFWWYAAQVLLFWGLASVLIGTAAALFIGRG